MRGIDPVAKVKSKVGKHKFYHRNHNWLLDVSAKSLNDALRTYSKMNSKNNKNKSAN
jgi:hypothetical protein